MTKTKTLTVEQLQEQLASAHEVIRALKDRANHDASLRGVDAFAVQKAMSNLENVISQRTGALQESEARYRALFDHSPDMSFIVNEDGTIVDANQTSAQGLNLSVEELSGQALASLFDMQVQGTVWRLIRSQKGTANELLLTSGQLVDVRIAKIPGQSSCQVSLADVTQKARLARELQHARRLAAIGRLAAGVAHEINNPLAVLQLGVTHISPMVSEPGQPMLGEILNHCDRIARIVNNLQTFAAPCPPKRERVELSHLIESSRDLARTSLQKMTFAAQMEPPSLAVMVDVGHLEQVFVNLFTNAARASHYEGKITIQAHRESSWVVVLVIDEGPGIPADLVDDIFTPFVSAYSHSTGTGLGLAISWGLVQENGGSIRACNTASGGACFELRLPAAEPAVSVVTPPQPPQLSAMPVASTSLRILCVEDEPTLLSVLESLLSLLGHQTKGASTAEDALSMLDEDTSFDVLLSDMRLPKMNGESFKQHVIQSFPELDGRVVLMSGMFHERKALYLQKPFTINDLQQLLSGFQKRS
jgi:PAS domain S-box-containing protein